MIRKFSAGLAVIALVCAASTVNAQDPNYTFSLSSGAAAAGGSVSIDALLTIDAAGGDSGGWSFGVCNGPELSVTNVDSSVAVQPGGGSIASSGGFVNDGFNANGWSQGVVVCLVGCSVIPSGTSNYLMATTDYSVSGAAAPGNLAINYCDTIGVPPVAVVVVVAGASIAPTTVSGNIEVLDIPDPAFTYIAPNTGATNYPAADGLTGVSVTANFAIAETDNSGLGATFPNQTQGFSMACTNDPAVVTPVSL
jgi:hypothetical protein